VKNERKSGVKMTSTNPCHDVLLGTVYAILGSVYSKLSKAEDQTEFVRLIGLAYKLSSTEKKEYITHMASVWKALEVTTVDASSPPSSPSSPSSPPKLCKGTKKDGTACTNKAKSGSDYCGIHAS
jgi:hypothetical protein